MLKRGQNEGFDDKRQDGRWAVTLGIGHTACGTCIMQQA
jgi:hypothetical protein